MDEELVETGQTAGERLRAARDAKKMTLEEIASTTRIPTRHLERLETGDWTKLPAPTDSVGFARSYAAAVGPIKAMVRSLDGAAISARMETLLAKPPRDMRKALHDWAKRHRVAID